MPTYVTDTHSLVWYLSDAPQLSPAARRAFDEAIGNRARIVVPVIVIAELIFMVERRRVQVDVHQIVRRISAAPNYEIVPLSLERVLDLQTVTAIPGMHDRIIVCEALAYSAKLITRDEAIRQAGIVEVVW